MKVACCICGTENIKAREIKLPFYHLSKAQCHECGCSYQTHTTRGGVTKWLMRGRAVGHSPEAATLYKCSSIAWMLRRAGGGKG